MAAYLIADIEVTDAQAYEEYRRRVPAIIAAHGGRYLVRGGAAETLEGTWRPNRTIVLEFPSIDALRAFWGVARVPPPPRHPRACGAVQPGRRGGRPTLTGGAGAR
jgi:uncharacterized protein (DUF1330 family)